MRLTTRLFILLGVLFCGIMWGVNSAEKGIQTIQGPKEAQAQSQTQEQTQVPQNMQITQIDGGKVEMKTSGTKEASTSAPSTSGNANWLSALGNGLRTEVISVARSSYFWVVKQL